MNLSPQQLAEQRFLEEYDFLRRYAVRCAPRYDLADDLINEVFKLFVNGAERWNLQSDIRPILVHLARAVSADLWREQQRQSPESLGKIAERMRLRTETWLDEADFHEEQQRTTEALDHCIELLPTKSRRLLEMHYWKRISMAHLAEVTGVKANALRQAMVRIREKLRRCIEQQVHPEKGEKHD